MPFLIPPNRGVTTKYRLGRTDSDWGWIQVSQNHLHPNSDFSSEFENFVGNTEKSKKMVYIHNFYLKIASSGGGHPPEL